LLVENDFLLLLPQKARFDRNGNPDGELRADYFKMALVELRGQDFPTTAMPESSWSLPILKNTKIIFRHTSVSECPDEGRDETSKNRKEKKNLENRTTQPNRTLRPNIARSIGRRRTRDQEPRN
jgi:hypothetical protein